MDNIDAFVLCKNEEANIGKCIESLWSAGVESITVFDSGSTDSSVAILERLGVNCFYFDYVDHAHAYNTITEAGSAERWYLILDADMSIEKQTLFELQVASRSNSNLDVLVSPVALFEEGVLLKYASLYPPKPIAFRGGRPYFESWGHGEVLMESACIHYGQGLLAHDDRKGFPAYLSSQARYADKIVAMHDEGKCSWKDRLRLTSPIGMFVSFLWSYILKGGFLDGRAGLLYLLDRMIAELCIYRAGVLSRMRKASR